MDSTPGISSTLCTGTGARLAVLVLYVTPRVELCMVSSRSNLKLDGFGVDSIPVTRMIVAVNDAVFFVSEITLVTNDRADGITKAKPSNL